MKDALWEVKDPDVSISLILNAKGIKVGIYFI